MNMLALDVDHVFLVRSLGFELGWQLPGSSVRSRDSERFEDAVSRILSRDIPAIDMVEAQPIAVMEKTYQCDGDKVMHRGLTFLGRVWNHNRRELLSNDDIKGWFVSVFDDEELSRLSDLERDLVKIARMYIRRRLSGQEEMVDQEIESTRSIPKTRHRVHDSFVKKLVSPFSSEIIKNRILERVQHDFSVLDVACGDDKFIFELAKRSKLCVGNDIEWGQIMASSGPSKNRPKNLIFFNHDARHLPFRQRFDFTLCKNLLHHMTTESDVTNLLRSLRKVSKRILIIDPENPTKSFRAKAWNFYYRKVLDDQGQNFFTRQSFESTLRDFFAHDKIDFSYDWTIKGTFMSAFIEVADSTHPTIKGIVFDLDGLLVDTEPLFFRAVKQALSGLNITVDEHDYIKHDLQNGSSVLEFLQRSGKLSDAAKAQEKVYEVYFHILTNEEIPPMRGAVEAVKRLAREYPLALASSSKREFIDLILKRIGLQNFFRAVVAREDVKRVKPDPECLSLATRMLGFSPEECLLIEDSQRGINAGRALGLHTVVVPNRMTADSLQVQNEIVLNSLNELTIDFVRLLTIK